ncbi:Beta-hexosaminidase [Arthrobacter sp. Bi83]|uniref:glycoside hydrolase family 3 N-terminal domain-containing protein n=1 Tax=Arthrobacter sp. Bi83 TaxID=2822353 RepID=UPI001E0571AA|nr:glycoside hydrolase family 3 N-terminal domain-containing protein [Arthrobacter sp. Bi83]CAH0223326.1 Beta-hexosaminidase [Arthrobacter sp. Bi83]
MRELSKISVLGVSLLLALASCAPPPSPAPGKQASRAAGTHVAAPAHITTAAPAAMAPQALAPAALTPAQQLARLTLAQRVGQLFMIASAATGADINTMSDITKYHVGSVYLAGRSRAGTGATAAVVRRMTATVSTATTGGIRLAVATDQEGGFVQVLGGPGFSVIPTAVAQGRQAPAVLQANARVWGNQLRAAGLNLNLAPVLDTVPSAQFAPHNAPIGFFGREYGFTPQTVSSRGGAFAAGMRQAGVAPAVKHFPGLGRVTLNTDTTRNVHDTVTTRTDPYLLPFRTAIQAGARWVMVSSAYYNRIDAAHIAPLSPVIMRTMLRGDLHFTGVILSDDLCNAAQLAPWAKGARATGFIHAGGTMLLCANPRDIPVMTSAVLQLAQHNPAFAAEVNAAALKVLTVKAGH